MDAAAQAAEGARHMNQSIRYVTVAAAIDLKNRADYYEHEPKLKDEAEIDDYDGGDWAELIGKGKRLYNQLNHESTNRN